MKGVQERYRPFVREIEAAAGSRRKGDILIDVGDIDLHALDMCYVQLSLLGYAAVVRHQDALSRKRFSADRYTPGWYIHSFPLRGIAA